MSEDDPGDVDASGEVTVETDDTPGSTTADESTGEATAGSGGTTGEGDSDDEGISVEMPEEYSGADGVTMEDVALEREFGEHATQVETSEAVPGIYGYGVVREVRPGEAVDEYVLEAPDGTEAVLTFDSEPSTSRSRHFAFFELVDVPPDRQLDALGQRVPFAYGLDEKRWVPVVPDRNTVWSRAKFRLMVALTYLRLVGVGLYPRDEEETGSVEGGAGMEDGSSESDGAEADGPGGEVSGGTDGEESDEATHGEESRKGDAEESGEVADAEESGEVADAEESGEVADAEESGETAGEESDEVDYEEYREGEPHFVLRSLPAWVLGLGVVGGSVAFLSGQWGWLAGGAGGFLLGLLLYMIVKGAIDTRVGSSPEYDDDAPPWTTSTGSRSDRGRGRGASAGEAGK